MVDISLPNPLQILLDSVLYYFYIMAVIASYGVCVCVFGVSIYGLHMAAV